MWNQVKNDPEKYGKTLLNLKATAAKEKNKNTEMWMNFVSPPKKKRTVQTDVVEIVEMVNMARIVGLAAASLQSQMLMSLDYKVRLLDHSFVVGKRHSLIPSVYGVCDINEKMHLTYSGDTFIRFRSYIYTFCLNVVFLKPSQFWFLSLTVLVTKLRGIPNFFKLLLHYSKNWS